MGSGAESNDALQFHSILKENKSINQKELRIKCLPSCMSLDETGVNAEAMIVTYEDDAC